jgi:hypothetical protein
MVDSSPTGCFRQVEVRLGSVVAHTHTVSPVDEGSRAGAGDTADYIAIRRVQSAYADIVTRRAWPELATIFLPSTEVEVEKLSKHGLYQDGCVGWMESGGSHNADTKLWRVLPRSSTCSRFPVSELERHCLK